MSEPGVRTDDQLLSLDLSALITGGLVDESVRGPDSARWLFAEGAIAASVQAERVGTLPRSLTFLAEIIRRGGVPYAAALPEPLPTQGQTELVRQWLAAAELAAPAEVTPAAGAATRDTIFARWLDSVALIIELRQSVGTRQD